MSSIQQYKVVGYVTGITIAAFVLGVLINASISQPAYPVQGVQNSEAHDAQLYSRIDQLQTILDAQESRIEEVIRTKPVTVTIPSKQPDIPQRSLGQIAQDLTSEALLDHTNDDFSHLTFWSTDFHITPISDLKSLLSQFGVKIIDKSLSGACGSTKTCATNLKVLNTGNGYNLGDEPHKLSKQLFEAYKNDEEFKKVDAIVCFHPIAQCQLYMPFNKTLIMISSTRYEHGQIEPKNWRRFNKMLQVAANNPRHLVAGNSVYDADYIKYFTNIDAIYIPSFCGHITARYRIGEPKKPEILLGHMHVTGGSLVWEPMRVAINAAAKRANTTYDFKGINEVYKGRYEYQQLADHRCIVHMPYQVSVMSMFEQYRMNLPLFYPSLDFLVELQQKHAVLSERTWGRVYGRGTLSGSDIEAASEIWWPDPNNDKDAQPLQFWLAKSDFYVKPHVILYSSWDDLIYKLETTDFDEVSKLMQTENERVEAKLKRQWKGVLHRLFKNRPQDGYAMPESFEEGMLDGWGMKYD